MNRRFQHVLLVATAFFLVLQAVADSIELWTTPRTPYLSEIVGARCYTIDGDILRDIMVIVAIPSANPGGQTAYQWQHVSGCIEIPGVVNGYDSNDAHRSVAIREISPSLNENGSVFAGKLMEVTVGEGITTLSGAFNGASDLRSVTLPSTLKTIGASSFKGCTALETIELPDAVDTIGPGAFRGCENLRNVKFSSSLQSIGDMAFENSGLASIQLPDECAIIGSGAFRGCTNLYSAKLGGCEDIGTSAFENCSALASIAFPQSLQTIGSCAFLNCTELSRVDFSEGLLSIGVRAFNNCTRIADLLLPDGLLTIGDRAFSYCTGVTRLHVPPSVTSVEANAFSQCTPKILSEASLWSMTYSSVTNFTLLQGAVSMGNKFKNCGALVHVELPDTLIRIETEAFSGCTNLSELIIPDTVEHVGNSAFNNCRKLSALPLLSGSVTNWGTSVFRYCEGVEKLSVPGNMKTIPSYMFANCSSLVDVVVSEGVETIPGTAFLYDDSLRKLSLPSTATNLSYGSYTKTVYAKNLEVVIFHQLHPPKNVTKAFLRNFTGFAYYPPDFADEWAVALAADGLAVYGKPWSAAREGEPGSVDVAGVDVPYGWLAKYGLTLHKTPEVAARAETGKIDVHGNPMVVWQDYVVGTDPIDMASRFTAMISISNGLPHVTWTPNLNTNGIVRRYTVFGKTDLAGDADWESVNASHRFFKVMVDMP